MFMFYIQSMMLTCKIVICIFFLYQHQLHLTHLSVQKLLLWGHSQVKECRLKEKEKEILDLLGTYRKLPSWKLKTLAKSPPTLQRYGTRSLANREYWWQQEMFPRKCKWMCSSSFSGPQKCECSITHIHPSIHGVYSAKSSLSASGQVNVWAAGDLARKMKRDWECFASIVECFFSVWV